MGTSPPRTGDPDRHDCRLRRPRRVPHHPGDPSRPHARAAGHRWPARVVRAPSAERDPEPTGSLRRVMPELVTALAVVLAPAGFVLGWLAVMALVVAALSGASSGTRLVNPPQDPTGGDRSA